MPSFDSYPSTDTLKMLYMGDTSVGKTGSLVALAAAGYNVRILDVDKGAQIIKGYVLNPDSPYRKARLPLWTAEQAATVASRISYVQIDDGMLLKNGKSIPRGDGWKKITEQLSNWKDGEQDYGPLESWTPREVLAIDGLSRTSDAAMNQQLVMAGRAVSGTQQQDWYPAQEQINRFLQMLCSPAVRCNVIVIAHVKYMENAQGIERAYPQTLGKALSPQVAQYFNTALLAKSSGQGTAVKRAIHTVTTGVVDLKNIDPLRVKPEYPLETGLAEYFQTVLGPLPAEVSKQPELPPTAAPKLAGPVATSKA